MGDVSVPEFDPTGPQLVYVALADHIAARIAAGELRPGARLPSERDLAAEYGVAYLTVRRAAAVLRERGLIVTVHGRGTYLTEPGHDESGPPGEVPDGP
jgi:DNA-binding GntR family transcriptional regulator